MPPPSNAPPSFGSVSSSTSSPGSSSNPYPPPARISPSASVARLSLGPFQQDAIASTTPPFSISRLPVARPFSSAGERSTSNDLRSTFGSSGHGSSRPWTTGEEWEPRFQLEHAAPPLPRQQYLPPPLAPGPPPSRQRFDSVSSYGGDQASSSSYNQGGGGFGERSSPGSGSEAFRYQPSSYSFQGQESPQQRQQQYEVPFRSIQQPHQRFISAPLPVAPRRDSAPASSTRPQTSHYVAPPPPRVSLPHLSTPSTSSSSSWSSHSFTNPWPYPLDPPASSSTTGHSSLPPQRSSEFSFTPFAPQPSSYQAHPYQPDPRQQHPQGLQYESSQPPSGERMDFDDSFDASSGPSYGHQGGPPSFRGGRGGYGDAAQ